MCAQINLAHVVLIIRGWADEKICNASTLEFEERRKPIIFKVVIHGNSGAFGTAVLNNGRREKSAGISSYQSY